MAQYASQHLTDLPQILLCTVEGSISFGYIESELNLSSEPRFSLFNDP